MKIAIGIIVGLLWGAAVALLNGYMTKRTAEKSDAKALTALSIIRSAVDICALAAVFFLRKLMPFCYEATLISTAVSMSLLTVFITYKISRSI